MPAFAGMTEEGGIDERGIVVPAPSWLTSGLPCRFRKLYASPLRVRSMRTGRLSISRGHQLQGEPVAFPPQLTLVPQPAEPGPAPVSVLSRAPPASPDYHLVHDRLTALERLTRLFELGTLAADEFAAEKALVLSLPADELVLREPAPVSFVPAAPRRNSRGPSLLGRLLGWKFLLFSLACGLAFSFATQPQATRHLFEQSLRLFGG